MVTTICFVDDIKRSFSEVWRVLKPHGAIVIGFVDKDSPVGKVYQNNKTKSTFYKDAEFFTTEEVIWLLKAVGFEIQQIRQTIFGSLKNIQNKQNSEEGYGKGSFVAIRADKP